MEKGKAFHTEQRAAEAADHKTQYMVQYTQMCYAQLVLLSSRMFLQGSVSFVFGEESDPLTKAAKTFRCLLYYGSEEAKSI